MPGRYWFPPVGTPCYPGEHYLWSRNWSDADDGVGFSYLGEDRNTPHIHDTGALPFPPPPAIAVGGPDCQGFSGTYPNRASLPLVSGIDPRCWLSAGLAPPPWSAPVATSGTIPEFTVVTDVLTDSPLVHNPAGSIDLGILFQALGGVLANVLYLPTGVVPDTLAGHYGVYIVAGGKAYLRAPDGTIVPLIAGPAGYVPRFNAAGDGLEASRITDPGSGAVVVSANLTVDSLLKILMTGGGGDSANWLATYNAILGNSCIWRVSHGPASGYQATLNLIADVGGPICDLGSIPGGGAVAYSINGNQGATISTDGWDVRGGLVLAVPGAADYATLLGLGSAAYADTTDFDAAGAASAAQTAAESYADGVAATAEANAESYADSLVANERKGYSEVATGESTGSGTPVSLTTTQTVSFTLGATEDVEVTCKADASGSVAANARIYAKLDSGTAFLLGRVPLAAGGLLATVMGSHVFASVGSGAHTITFQFSTSAGTMTFSDRCMTVRRI